MSTALQGYASPFARFQHVLELRREGLTYGQIADRVGVTPRRAQALMAKAVRSVLRETAEEVRHLELARVEAMIHALWNDALAGAAADPPDFAKFDRVKQLIEVKLRWCGAQAVVEGAQDNRVQIIVQQFTRPAAPKALPAPEPEEAPA